jgi:transcriptional regulator with GAF, ATPase, and Fis domain
VNGPLGGAHFALGPGGLRIGRGESADIQLNEPDAAAEHCVVTARDGGYHIEDCHTRAGTYVNGMRITRHRLEAGDEISIGESVLVYREDTAAASAPQQHTLLRACSLLFLFRALAGAANEQARATVEDHIVRLVADMVPCSGGLVLLGRDAGAIRAAARGRRLPEALADLPDRIFREGTVSAPDPAIAAVALSAQGEIAGMLAAWFPPEEAVNLADHLATLSAVATLAGSAFEGVQDVEHLQPGSASLLDRIEACPNGIVGESPAIRKLLQSVARVAPQDTPVLILGESGTGKELVARPLHRQRARAGKPFVAINCAALTETLLESELFGHERGAFTGAVAQKPGKLEIAQGGTVFLDEVGELAPALQAKLLRVLQEREFERVGGTRTLSLDIRLIAATNRDLLAEVRRGAFREDLYHRLNVIALRVPALRDRAEDIPRLARYLLERTAVRCGRRVTGISPETEQCLMAYSWPGNVRELENAVERAVVLGESETIQPEDLPETVLGCAAPGEDAGGLESSVKDAKRQLVLTAWRESGGDPKQAAARLNIHPNSFRRLVRTLKLREIRE